MGKLRFIEYENIYVERLIFFVDLSIFFDNYFDNISFFCRLKSSTFF